MSAPHIAEAFHRFPDLFPELRLMVWETALPDYGTVPVASVIKEAALETLDLATIFFETPQVTWTLKALPRSQWPKEVEVRNQTIQNLSNVNFEARQEVKKRFPAILEPESGRIYLNPAKDLILLSRAPSLETLFFHHEMSISYAGDWNLSIHKLAIEHSLLSPFLANVFEELNSLTSFGHDVVRGLLRVLDQFPNLEQLSLVNSRKVLLAAWNNTPEQQRSELRTQLGASYSSGLQMVPSTDVPTALASAYATGPFQTRHVTLLKRAVENLGRIVHGDVRADESLIFVRYLDVDWRRLQRIDIRKMYHLSAELQGLCLDWKSNTQ